MGLVRVRVPVSDLFGVAGTRLLDELAMDPPFLARVGSLRRLIAAPADRRVHLRD
jgi:hypothetical protein